MINTPLFLLKMDVPLRKVSLYVHALQDCYGNVTWQDVNSTAYIEVYIYEDERLQNTSHILNKINQLLSNHQLPTPQSMSVTPFQSQDWLTASQNVTNPISVGKFYIHGAKNPSVEEKINLVFDPGVAFGTGTHPTTKGCLLALSDFTEIPVKKVLDMGCGSGILGIAAARLLDATVLAVDNAPLAIRATQDNAKRNHVAHNIFAKHRNGYNDLRKDDIFDLIICNILSNTLCEMAPSLKQHLAPSGKAILSGLLENQQKSVIEAHEAMNLKLQKKIVMEKWVTLVFKNAKA